MTTTSVESDNFPILGEPLPVELANTLYTHAGGVIDFLATPDLIASWFAQAPAASDIVVPPRLTTRCVNGVREVRDAVHGLLDARVEKANGADVKDVTILNRHAASASCRPRLEWNDGDGPKATAMYSGGAFEVLVARLAADAIRFVAGPELGLVRRCGHPDCQMFFVQHHHRRRFCHESCAHRARQARYYLARTTAGHPKEP